MLKENLRIAKEQLLKAKEQDSQIRGRIETCVNRTSVKLYIIKKEKVQEIITIDQMNISRRKK